MARRRKPPTFKVNKVREAVFNDIFYDIVWKTKGFKDGSYAECILPDDIKKKEIRIAPKNLSDQKELLNTLIHEVVHAHWANLAEDYVSKFADGLADFLWEVGYRLPLKDTKPVRKTG